MVPRIPPRALTGALLALVVVGVVLLFVLDSTVGVVLAAVAVALGVGSLAATLNSVLTGDDEPGVARPAVVHPGVAGFGVLTIVVLAIAVVLGQAESDRTDTGGTSTANAESTARSFLAAAVVEQNGETACSYLSAEQERAVEQALRSGTCRSGIGGGAVFATALPASSSGVRSLDAATQRQGDRVTVRLSAGGKPLVLGLRLANQAERDASFAPDSVWRIDRGATAILRG